MKNYIRSVKHPNSGIYPPRICDVCGRLFAPASIRNTICSSECREEQAFRKSAEQQNRPFTPLTVYLVHKYFTEGDSVDEISELLGRSRENVLEALTRELSPLEEKKLNACLIPRKPGTATDKRRKPHV